MPMNDFSYETFIILAVVCLVISIFIFCRPFAIPVKDKNILETLRYISNEFNILWYSNHNPTENLQVFCSTLGKMYKQESVIFVVQIFNNNEQYIVKVISPGGAYPSKTLYRYKGKFSDTDANFKNFRHQNAGKAQPWTEIDKIILQQA